MCRIVSISCSILFWLVSVWSKRVPFQPNANLAPREPLQHQKRPPPSWAIDDKGYSRSRVEVRWLVPLTPLRSAGHEDGEREGDQGVAIERKGLCALVSSFFLFSSVRRTPAFPGPPIVSTYPSKRARALLSRSHTQPHLRCARVNDAALSHAPPPSHPVASHRTRTHTLSLSRARSLCLTQVLSPHGVDARRGTPLRAGQNCWRLLDTSEAVAGSRKFGGAVPSDLCRR